MLNRAKIIHRSIGSSATQLLKDQIGLQTQQQGLAWIGLACRSPLLQKLSLVELQLAGPAKGVRRSLGGRVAQRSRAFGSEINSSQSKPLASGSLRL